MKKKLKLERIFEKQTKTNTVHRLIENARNSFYKSSKGFSKFSPTKDILGIVIETYRRLIEYQFTTEMSWSNTEIDHVRPICSLDVSKDEELREAFTWVNTQPLPKEVRSRKGSKYNRLDYKMQFIKA